MITKHLDEENQSVGAETGAASENLQEQISDSKIPSNKEWKTYILFSGVTLLAIIMISLASRRTKKEEDTSIRERSNNISVEQNPKKKNIQQENQQPKNPGIPHVDANEEQDSSSIVSEQENNNQDNFAQDSVSSSEGGDANHNSDSDDEELLKLVTDSVNEKEIEPINKLKDNTGKEAAHPLQQPQDKTSSEEDPLLSELKEGTKVVMKKGAEFLEKGAHFLKHSFFAVKNNFSPKKEPSDKKEDKSNPTK